jgi:uncharacterized membrane protein
MRVPQGSTASERGHCAAAAAVVHRRSDDDQSPAPGLAVAGVLTLASIALLHLRFEWAQSPSFAYLYWNLALAWVPYLFSLAALCPSCRRSWTSVPLAGVTLLFLPNAPYLVTDFVHLRDRADFPEFADALMLLTFAATGWFLGLMSLHIWRRIVETQLGSSTSRVFLVLAAFATGFGVYLGRFLRWNSWDPVREPRRFAAGIAARVVASHFHPLMVGFTLAFGVIFLVSYAWLSPRLERSASR